MSEEINAIALMFGTDYEPEASEEEEGYEGYIKYLVDMYISTSEIIDTQHVYHSFWKPRKSP